MQITFIGGGNMAQAIIGGLVRRGYEASAITVVEPWAEARARVAALGAKAVASAAEARPGGALLVMAVKPQQMREAAQSCLHLLPGQPVLSIAAGIRLDDLGRWLGGHALLARCMPNTPALIGAGVTAAYARPEVDREQRHAVNAVLEAVGTVVWVEEEALLDPVTAVSGSGPAYVFYFIEALEAAGLELGLAPETARALALQTFAGAAQLAVGSAEPPSVLRERVTSKGGTTEQALASMQADKVGELIRRAVRAANDRAREMGEQLGRDA